MILAVSLRYLSSNEKDLNVDSNPHISDAGAVLYQLNYQPNWEGVLIRTSGLPLYKFRTKT